jgi:hypothetical protein
MGIKQMLLSVGGSSMRLLSILTFGLLMGAIPSKADNMSFTVDGVYFQTFQCCQSLSTGEPLDATGGVSIDSLPPGKYALGLPAIDMTFVTITTGALVGSAGNTLTFEGGTITNLGEVYNDVTNPCPGFVFTTGACVYGSIGGGVIVGDLTLTQEAFNGDYEYALSAPAEFLYYDYTLGFPAFVPTMLYDGTLTGTLSVNGDLFSADDMESLFSQADVELTFRGTGTPVPEPTSIIFLGTVVIGVGFAMRRKVFRND